MNIRYDPATDSLHIHLSDRPSVDSNEVQDGVLPDYDANGDLVGIDLQKASQRGGYQQPVGIQTTVLRISGDLMRDPMPFQTWRSSHR